MARKYMPKGDVKGGIEAVIAQIEDNIEVRTIAAQALAFEEMELKVRLADLTSKREAMVLDNAADTARLAKLREAL